ncbi:hypothetical protein [Variovorax sp. JS1663]|uniref:hypothetical protein n=1 Tax=Variovorax sp. JS1663 TaxID=1851577 RepID=UPI000B346205|nr:hypothetical protein [Variovorax sp. JS1663]OUM00962.1 hypothetical protein A8M77_18865 [Variovorax sp. JS1663]
MMTWLRWVLWVVCLATVASLWLAGALGTGAALATGGGSLLLFVWPGHRRRRTALRYIEMGKQPIGLH